MPGHQSIYCARSAQERAARQRENFDIDDFALSDDDMRAIDSMDRGSPLILNITSLDEVYRLYGITFEQ